MRSYMISSPPQEAEHIRGKTLTPESPKPLHVPSPSNIPILEDPMFHDSAEMTTAGTPVSLSSAYGQSQVQLPYQEALSHAASLYAPDSQAAAAAAAAYPQQAAYGNGGFGSQMPSTSIQSFPSQNQAPSSYDPNAYAAQQAKAQLHGDASNGNGNGNGSGAPDQYAPQPYPPQGQPELSSLPAAANLPPRPPPQDKYATNPNFNPNDDIRSFHPHSQQPAAGQYRSTGQLQQPSAQAGASNTASNAHATTSNQSPTAPGYGPSSSVDLISDAGDDEDRRWPPEINRLYENFLEEERRYVTDGRWDMFPSGSRLFIGNLPTEKVTKRDIYHRFYRHGKLAQISIKQAYGFVQFLDTESAEKALRFEQGASVRGRKMHLEISKPQKNTRKNDDRNSGRRRSRSPDYTRGGSGPQARNVDRYTGSQAMSPRERDNRRFRDEYRGRSPSPQRGGRFRGRDRSRDRYDGRRRSRSRSPRRYRSPSPRRDLDDELPLPFRQPHQIPDIQVLVVNEGLPNDYIRWVEESFKKEGLRADVLILSPRLSEEAVIRRQIVEGVLAVVKLNSGTLAKSKVNLRVFDRRAGGGQVTFNEYADLDPIMAAALVTQVKATQAQPQPAPQAPTPAPAAYGYPYGVPAAPPAQAAPVFPNMNVNAPPTNMNVPPNLTSLLSTLDPSSLSTLLGAMAQSKPPVVPSAQPSGPTPTPTPDLTRLLESLSGGQQQQRSYGVQQHQQSQMPFSQDSYQNPALVSLLGAAQTAQHAGAPAVTQGMQIQSMQSMQQQQSPHSGIQGMGQGHQGPQAGGQQQPQPDMNEIMKALAKYQR